MCVYAQINSVRMSHKPIVSVIVLTFNSSEFVIETLESIRLQEYGPLELLIADDCSSDDTLALVEEWLASFSTRFTRTLLISSPHNTGTSANCNRGLNAAEGEWIKLIAGDDVLHPSFFTEMSQLLADPAVHVIAGEVHEFVSDVSQAVLSWPDFPFPTTYQEQRKRQLVKGLLLAPSVAMRRETVLQLGGFDTTYKLFEDDPMWFKLTLAGYLFHFSPRSKVFYRQHVGSVNSIAARQIYYRKPVFLNDLINFGHQVRLPALIRDKFYLHALVFYLGLTFEKIIYKNGSKLDSHINKLSKKIVVGLSKISSAIPF